MTLKIAVLGNSIRLEAESDGLWIRREAIATFALDDRGTWPNHVTGSDDGRLLAIEVEQLLEQGLAEVLEGQLRIPYSSFSIVRQLGLQLVTRWTKWSPFMISISPFGDLGRSDFAYKYRFYLGSREVDLERIGYYIVRKSHAGMYHLDDQTFALIEAMDRFNNLDPGAKTERENWLTFSVVKGCAAEVGAALDKYLHANEVVVPSRVALKIQRHEDDSISFVPRCSGVPDNELEKAFLALPEVGGTYSVDLGPGQRLRVVLDDEQQEVLRRMKNVRRATGELKRKAMETPEAFFDGVLQSVDLPYGRRVEGVGEFQFASTPGQFHLKTGIFDGVERLAGFGDVGLTDQESSEVKPLEGTRADNGEKILIQFATPQARTEFGNRVKEAFLRNIPAIDWQGFRVRVDHELKEALVPETVDFIEALQKQQEHPKDASGKYLQIYTNEVDLKPWDIKEAQASAENSEKAPRFERPLALSEEVRLKAHQIEGVAWLQLCHKLRERNRRGGLLADDMGMGKTLQVLIYLAWCIENSTHADLGLQREAPPWRPILIITPLMLVEDRTWEREMQHFFTGVGSIFAPITTLHGKNINTMRLDNALGRELTAGKPSLDPKKLQQFRVLITNYETIVNYQHSFAQTLDGQPLWSIVVSDEAHGYRTPNTKVSHAVKALPSDFHVACTGTPVENRLLDVWNIFDAIQPALLGTARQFSDSYERPLGSSDPSSVLESLKDRLLFQKPNAFLLRRDKSKLQDLPSKREVRLRCEMSDFERQTHRELLASLRDPSKRKAHLGVLHKLAQLYQHRDLLQGNWERKTSDDLIERSKKLQEVIKVLRQIKEKGEKAIIFARFIAMQQILVVVLGDVFNLHIRIINGETTRDSASRSSSNTLRAKVTRAQILAEFRERLGFDVLILSPFVAGIGLTITEANHVIHYGRWWNPAVEAQATDRVYRIGQEKDVKVYLPIYRDGSELIQPTFDEAVDSLLQKKSDLARDFLQPRDSEETIAEELCGTLLREEEVKKTAARVEQRLDESEIRALSPFDFEALVSSVWRSRGYETVLTPRGSDGGVDVAAVSNEEFLLIQTKHSSSKTAIAPDAIDDVVAGQMVYQKYLNRPCRLVIVTNSKFSKDCAGFAAESGVELVDGQMLLRYVRDARTSRSDILLEEESRCPSFKAGISKIKNLVSRCS